MLVLHFTLINGRSPVATRHDVRICAGVYLAAALSLANAKSKLEKNDQPDIHTTDISHVGKTQRTLQLQPIVQVQQSEV